MLEADNCTLCGYEGTRKRHSVREMMFGSKETFAYAECPQCGALELIDIPEDVAAHYPSDYYAFKPVAANVPALKKLVWAKRADHTLGRPNPIGAIWGKKVLSANLALLADMGATRDSKILDIGCGSGTLLVELENYGFKSLKGIDPFIEDSLTAGNAVPILKETIYEHTGKYDIVMLHHVFEHMGSPAEVLARLGELLEPKGRLLIRIPIADCFAWRHYGVDWIQIDAPRHFFIHTRMRKGVLVVLESTTYPATTDEDLRAVLEEGSGLKAGRDFHLAFSPEREDPGNPNSKVAEIPKLVGGLTPACCDKACALYRQAIKTVIPLSSCRAAEAAKLLENIFRSVNIALVNELKMVYDAMGIDVWEVINAAKTKPFGFMAFYPGPGLGGHCIPIDPFYLTWKAREYGQNTRFIELAGEINTAMPHYVVERTAAALNAQRKSINGSRLLICGLAYKANVDDMRESPAFHLLDLFQARGATVAYYDPFIPVIGPTREHAAWKGVKSVRWDRKTISSFDAVVICTAHDAVNYAELAAWSPCIVDSRNAMAKVKTKKAQVWKA